MWNAGPGEEGPSYSHRTRQNTILAAHARQHAPPDSQQFKKPQCRNYSQMRGNARENLQDVAGQPPYG